MSNIHFIFDKFTLLKIANLTDEPIGEVKLKVRHLGRQEAKKARDYIKYCDLVSPEAAGKSREDAEKFEEEWSKILRMSRSEFRRKYDLGRDGKVGFNLQLQEDIHYNKKPIYLLERFNPKDSQLVKGMEEMYYGTKYTKQTLDGAISGEPRSVVALRDRLFSLLSSLDLRDRQIGEILNTSESEIRRRFVELSGKQDIKVVALIGRWHFPELHSSVRTQVFNLYEYDLPYDLLIRRLYPFGNWQNPTDEDVKEFANLILNGKD